MERTIALVGAAHPAARALALALEETPGVSRVLGLSTLVPPVLGPKFEYVPMATADRVVRQLEDAHTVVVFPRLTPVARDAGRAGGVPLSIVCRILEAIAAETGSPSRRVVLWSNAAVYGTRETEHAPLDEGAPLRPDPADPVAFQLARAERLVLGLPGQAGTVLRAAPVWSDGWGTPQSRLLRSLLIPTVPGLDPPLQALHPVDAVSALILAVREERPGAYNVAPADWVHLRTAARLAGRLTFPVPESLAGLGVLPVTSAPPVGTLSPSAWQTAHPPLLDATLLRAAGWAPSVTTAAALVEAGRTTRPAATGRAAAAAAAVVGVAGVTTALLLRSRRRR